jgi:hypothetical protein
VSPREPRQPGRHSRRALRAARRDQLATVASMMSVEQLHAAMRRLIERDPRLARDVIDAAVAEYPIQPPPMIP